MKLFKKNMSHSLLAALLVLFIVFDIKIPNEVAKLINTLLGRVVVAGGAIALLLNNPLLGILAIVAGYELLRRSDDVLGGGQKLLLKNKRWKMPNGRHKYIPSEASKQRDFDSLNQFPTTLEETVIHNMIPFVSDELLSPPSFRPTLDSLYDAARLN